MFPNVGIKCKCSIGDQLDPKGKLSEPVYDLIGSVYSQVKEKEPWCRGAKPVTEIGVLTPEEFEKEKDMYIAPSLMGITRMLQESSHQFDIIDSQSEFSKYKVIVLPDFIPVSDELSDKLGRYLDNGGALIASFQSGLNESKEYFNLKQLGIELIGEAPYSPRFYSSS